MRETECADYFEVQYCIYNLFKFNTYEIFLCIFKKLKPTGIAFAYRQVQRKDTKYNRLFIVVEIIIPLVLAIALIIFIIAVFICIR